MVILNITMDFMKKNKDEFSINKNPIFIAFSSLKDFEFFEELKLEDIQIKKIPSRKNGRNKERGR